MTHTVKHTPGPWQLDISPSGFAHILSEKELVGTIGHIDRVNVKANAAFIAAAPAMYEALSELVKYLREQVADEALDTWEPVFKAAKALAQAEGC